MLQYPPGYAVPAAGAKKSNLAVIIAVVVVVVVVGSIIAAAVLYVMVTGLGGPTPGSTRPTVTLAPGTWSGGSLVVSITSASSSIIDTAGLTYQILSTSGVFYFNGASGTTTMQSGTNTTVTYNDVGGMGASRVGPDDNIVIQVQPNANALHGTTFKVLQGADVLGTMVIP